MNFYDIFMSPLEKILLRDIRKKLISKATGQVLEIGAGTGVNFKYYNTGLVGSINVLDIDVDEIAKRRAPEKTIFTEYENERFPYENDSFDTVVETLVLCSVEEDRIMMEEVRRVLKPNGLFIHIDHGMPNNKKLNKVFSILSPLWYQITKSCRIDKNQRKTIEDAGFAMVCEGASKKGVFYWGIHKNNKK